MRQNEDPVRAEEDPDAGVPAPAIIEGLLRKQGVDRASCWVAIGDVWAVVHAALALPVFESDN